MLARVGRINYSFFAISARLILWAQLGTGHHRGGDTDNFVLSSAEYHMRMNAVAVVTERRDRRRGRDEVICPHASRLFSLQGMDGTRLVLLLWSCSSQGATTSSIRKSMSV
jgi:hypothetical protein